MAEIKAEGVPVHPSGPKRADRRRGIAIGLMLLAVYLVTMGGHTYSIDDEGYLAGSRALLHGTVELDQQSDLTGKIAATRSKDGEWTSIGGYLAFLGELAFARPTSVAGFADVLTSPSFSEAA